MRPNRRTRSNHPAQPLSRPRPLVLAVAMALAASAGAQTLPSGGVAVQGQATIATQGRQMTVTTTANAVLNWQSFSIGAGQAVRFDQPAASSQVLNRVLGRDPSHIHGQLSSNGTVWLVNPYGVLFGASARVDVAGLVASTLNISDADWQARRFSLLGGADAGPLVNRGEIRTSLGGRVLLVGGAAGVRNEGLIEAPGGQVALAAGASVDLADTHSPQLAVRVTAPAGEALNLGRALAPGGVVDLAAAMVNQQGIVRADRLDAGPGGEVRLSASQTLELAAGSRTSADGASGGRIVAEGGTTLVAGAVSADGRSGAGGDIRLLGRQVGLLDGARVSASGDSGGGQVLVGGGLQGRDVSVPNARAVYMAPGASVHADAHVRGDGGRVILWSDEATRAYGAISARGGRDGGDGGFIETSGGWLDARPASIRTDAPKGRPGQWLLDPNDIVIADGEVSDLNISAGPNFRSTDDSAVITTATIAAALEAGNNVTITTATGGSNSQSGDIFWFGTLSVEPPNAVSLTLNAHRHITLDGANIFDNPPLSLTLNAGTGGSGNILIEASSINIGGNLTLGGPSRACGAPGCATFDGAVGTNAGGRGFGVDIQDSSLFADRIRIRGSSAADSQTHGGVRIGVGSVLGGSQIDIAGWAGSGADVSQYGVDVQGTLAAVDRLIIDGTSRLSGGAPTEGNAIGVRLSTSGSLLVGPDAVSGGEGGFFGGFGAIGRARAQAADPNRYLRITGRSDDDGSSFTSSVLLDGSLWVTDKAGITITGGGGKVWIETGSFDAFDAGNLLIGGSSQLVLRTDDAFLPNAEPVRFTNTQGVLIQGSMFGTPSAMTIDSPSGTIAFDDSSFAPSVDIGSAPFSARGAAFEMGLQGNGAQLEAGRVTIRADRIEIGPSSLIAASAAGDAIVLAGLGGNVSTLLIDAGTNPLSTPNGRWLVFATDPNDGDNFQPGALARDFTQYDASYPGTTVLGSGNGMLFSLAPVLQVSAEIQGSTSKTYDGSTSTSATLGEATLTGLLSGDSLLDSPEFGALRYSSADAADKVPFVVSLQGGVPEIADSSERPVYGYRYSGRVTDVSGTIRPRALTIDGLGSLDKVYDGTTAVSLAQATLGGLVAGESLTLLPGTVAFDTANAGRDKLVSGVFALADGPGGQASNYRLEGDLVFSTRATITPRPLTLAGATVLDKVYDGSAAATLIGGTLTGLVGAQTLTLTTGAARFDTPDAGRDKPVNASVQLADGANGGLAANYTLGSAGVLTLAGNILPRPVSLASLSVADKVYDGTTIAPATAGALQGVLPGENLVATVDARFADARVGADKPVSAQVVLADGVNGRASNYTLGGNGTQLTASILPRPLTVSGVFANDKPYDGTTAATLSAGVMAGLVPGESLNLAALASFDDKAVGTGKLVRGTIALADGTGGTGLASNYVLTNGGAFEGRAAIVPRGLALAAASAGSKTYDGDTSIAVSGLTLVGVLPGEQVTVTGGSGRFDDPNVGDGKPVTATASGLSGPDAANYSLAQASVRTQGGITPATLRFEADALSTPVGYPLPLLTGAITGFVGTDTLQTATSGSLRFDTPATSASPAGSYAVTGSGLSARNYRFEQAAGNATALSIVPLSTSKVGEPTSTAPGLPALLAGLQPVPVVTSVQAHRTFDVLPALQSAPPNFSFGAFDLDGTSQQDLARMLAARDRYKKALFADAIRELENNPAAADAPACQTVEQAVVGECLVTEVLKPAVRERLAIEFQPLPVPSAPPPPTPATPPVAAAPSPAAPVPPPVAAAPAPAPAVAPPAAAPRPPVVAAVEPPLRLPAARAVRSAALPQIQRKWALLIGTDVYADRRIPQLDNAVADVEAVTQVLEGPLGYQTIVVRNGSKAAILRAFNQLASVVAPADSVAIYYAGHGELVDKLGLGFWQPSDADASRAETWISNTDIGKLLGQITASQVVLVSDSCFSGSLVSDERIRGGVVPDAAALLSRRAAVVMSSGGNEPVFDSGKNGHSAFAWSFMRALEGVSSWRPGGNLFEQVRFAVARQVPQRPQYGASRLGGHQTGADYVFEQRQLESAAK